MKSLFISMSLALLPSISMATNQIEVNLWSVDIRMTKGYGAIGKPLINGKVTIKDRFDSRLNDEQLAASMKSKYCSHGVETLHYSVKRENTGDEMADWGDLLHTSCE